MKKKPIALSLLAIVATVAVLFSACRKINEATELGGDLIPPVDNINTFDTLITVQAFNDTFGLATDTQFLSKDAEFFLGRINNDPFFGRTDAKMFFQLKPPVFPFTFMKPPASLAIDSVVLVLDHIENYGDENSGQIIQVYELDQTNDFRADTLYVIRKNPFTYSNLLGSKGLLPKNLKDSVKAFRDTTAGQLRIKLNNSFGTRLLNYDTANNGAYKNDSIFQTKFKGFAVQSQGPGNALMGLDLAGDTKLAIYYRYLDGGGPTSYDTTVAYFTFSGAAAAANYIGRDYTATPLLASLNNGTTPDQEIFIQGSPGTFTMLKIPDLLNVSNRVVHRAELIVEELYHPSDTVFTAPQYLYLDAFDPTITSPGYKFRTIPYDLSYTSSGSLNLNALGVNPLTSKDAAGNTIKVWKFNLSRYVQHVLTRTQSLYDLRLFAPYTYIENFGLPPGPDTKIGIQLNPAVAKGRVRLGGTNPANPQRVRLRIIYSRL